MHIGTQQASDHSAVHPIDYFVDGAVAAQHQDQVGAISDCLRRKFGSMSGFLGRKKPRMQTRAAEGVSGTLKCTLGVASESAGCGIIDENRLLICCDLPSITPKESNSCAMSCGAMSIFITCSTPRKSPTPSTIL